MTRVPVSRSRPQVEQSDIPTGTTPPHVGQRRAFDRASAALGRRADFFGPSSNSAWASATGFEAGACLIPDAVAALVAAFVPPPTSSKSGTSKVSRTGPETVGSASALESGREGVGN
jgi:hypothetical protein